MMKKKLSMKTSLYAEKSITDLSDQVCLVNSNLHSLDEVELYTVDDFLNEAECTKLIYLLRQSMFDSVTVSTEKNDKKYRKSKSSNIADLHYPFIVELDRRICKYMGIDNSFGESIQAQWYDVGDEYKAHYDYFNAEEAEVDGSGVETKGQRTWTFMIYLNDVEKGGETEFVNYNFKIKPKRGMAVIWNNRNNDGSNNTNTLHQAHLVQVGYKAVVTKWFREKSVKFSNFQFNKTDNEKLPAYTRSGFHKMKMPELLFQSLNSYYELSKTRPTKEIESVVTNQQREPSALIELNQSLKDQVHQILKPVVEAWSGTLLVPTYVYGIREYYDGSILQPHRDRCNTHVVSIILNVAQKVSEKWPLQIEDHFYRQHEIILSPGDMLLYEGGKLKHSRQTPFNGNHYANVFVHYIPKSMGG